MTSKGLEGLRETISSLNNQMNQTIKSVEELKKEIGLQEKTEASVTPIFSQEKEAPKSYEKNYEWKLTDRFSPTGHEGYAWLREDGSFEISFKPPSAYSSRKVELLTASPAPDEIQNYRPKLKNKNSNRSAKFIADDKPHFRINVTGVYLGKGLCLEVDPEENVREVKEAIESYNSPFHIPIELQKLRFQGKWLENDKFLRDYGIQNGSILQIAYKLFPNRAN